MTLALPLHATPSHLCRAPSWVGGGVAWLSVQDSPYQWAPVQRRGGLLVLGAHDEGASMRYRGPRGGERGRYCVCDDEGPCNMHCACPRPIDISDEDYRTYFGGLEHCQNAAEWRLWPQICRDPRCAAHRYHPIDQPPVGTAEWGVAG